MKVRVEKFQTCTSCVSSCRVFRQRNGETEALQHLRATLAGRQGAARHMVGYKMRLDWQGVLLGTR